MLKALTGWSLGRIADNCRERCGGMGFLEANRFGYAISGSHSSRTAEGDNSVLMNKVASELIRRVDQNEVKKTFFKMWGLKYAPSFMKSGIKTDPRSLIETLATFKEYSICNLAMKMFQVLLWSFYQIDYLPSEQEIWSFYCLDANLSE